MYDCVSDFLCPILPTLEIVWDLHLCVTVMVMLMRGASALQRFPLTVESLMKGGRRGIHARCSLGFYKPSWYFSMTSNSLHWHYIGEYTYRKNRAWSLVFVFLSITHV